jgi:hypothetical protein
VLRVTKREDFGLMIEELLQRRVLREFLLALGPPWKRRSSSQHKHNAQHRIGYR